MKSIFHLGRHLGSRAYPNRCGRRNSRRRSGNECADDRRNDAYMRGDFAGAAKADQQALDAEKKQPTLDRPTTITLIDNLWHGLRSHRQLGQGARGIRLRRFQVPHASYLLLRYCLHLWPQKRCGECHHLSPEGVCQ